MRHGLRLGRLNRDSKHRQALLRNLVGSLIEHERICTTVAKAKELKRAADKAVTMAKNGQEARLRAYLYSKPAVEKIMGDLAIRFKSRNGGYTRLKQIGHRKGDAAPMAIIELVDSFKMMKLDMGTTFSSFSSNNNNNGLKKNTSKSTESNNNNNSTPDAEPTNNKTKRSKSMLKENKDDQTLKPMQDNTSLLKKHHIANPRYPISPRYIQHLNNGVLSISSALSKNS
jgi:large subunit ribosomal protein L17